jgi:PAS domain S-box-containing protein
MEEALQKSEEKFSKAFRESPVTLTLTSAKDHRYIDVNETFEHLTGYSREEILRHTALDLSIWVDPSQRVEFVKQLLAEGRIRSQEIVCRAKDGSLRIVLGSAELIEIDGEPVVLSAAVDITERKRAEKALRESEEKFRRVFQDAVTGMVMISLEGRFLAVNQAFCEFLGYSEKELVGRNVLSVTHPEDHAHAMRMMGQALAGESGSERFEKRSLHKNGQVLWAELRTTVIRDSAGKPEYFVSQIVDITERKRAEEVLAGMSRKLIEAQEQERARIGRELHDDINQRLAMLAVELEQLQANPSEVGSRVLELRKQTIEISNDVQALSHDLHSSQLEYLGVVAGMKSWCKEFGERQGMQIECRHDVRSTLSVEIGLCLFRVLQEALHNAAKHSGVKQIEVQLHEESGEIHLIVTDSGRGFDVEAVKQGKGLGLTSMRERVRLLDGSIAIDSKPMGGTAIHVSVPLKSQHSSQQAAV